MFPDKKGGLEDLINTYKIDGDFHSNFGTEYMNTDITQLMKQIGGLLDVKEEFKKEMGLGQNAPVRLTKNAKCPVCEHKIRQEFYHLGEGGSDEYQNTCDQCGFTDFAFIGNSQYHLTIEDFRWEFHVGENDEEMKRKVKEQRRVLELYKGFWKGTALTAGEEEELDTIVSAQNDLQHV